VVEKPGEKYSPQKHPTLAASKKETRISNNFYGKCFLIFYIVAKWHSHLINY
jgi:hypothetical protein